MNSICSLFILAVALSPAVSAALTAECVLPYKDKELNLTLLSHPTGSRETLFAQHPAANAFLYVNPCRATTAPCANASVCFRATTFEYFSLGDIDSAVVEPLACSVCKRSDRGYTLRFSSEGGVVGSKIHVVCDNNKDAVLEKVLTASPIYAEAIVYSRAVCSMAFSLPALSALVAVACLFFTLFF